MSCGVFATMMGGIYSKTARYSYTAVQLLFLLGTILYSLLTVIGPSPPPSHTPDRPFFLFAVFSLPNTILLHAMRSRLPEIQWASGSNRIYVRSGCARISDIMAERTDNTGQKGPIYHFDQVISKHST